MLRRGITSLGRTGLRGQARPGVYFYKRVGGDSYVTVTLRDASPSANYNLVPTTPLRLPTPPKNVALGRQGQGHDEHITLNKIFSLPCLQYRPKTLDELSYHEELSTRLRSLVSDPVHSPLLRVWPRFGFYVADLGSDRPTRVISLIYLYTDRQGRGRRQELVAFFENCLERV